MDMIPVVLRHAWWSRDPGGLGWRYLVIQNRGGARWNRFPWAESNIAKQVALLTTFRASTALTQETIKARLQRRTAKNSVDEFKLSYEWHSTSVKNKLHWRTLKLRMCKFAS